MSNFTNTKINESLKEGCQEAIDVLQKLEVEDFADLKAKLEWVVGSYEYDNNPIGLHEIGTEALAAFQAYKEQKPKAITKKSLDKIEKCLVKFEEEYLVK